MKKKVLLYKSPVKPLAWYKSMTQEQRESHVQKMVAKLHELNNKRVFAIQKDQDLKLTMLGHYDIAWNCDLYGVCL